MNLIKLKPQFNIAIIDEKPVLVTELTKCEENPKYLNILQRLIVGVDPDSLTDEEFDYIQYFSDRGYLSIDDHPDSAIWDLTYSFSTARDQLGHVTFSIVDLTKNHLGIDISSRLESAGLKISETPTIVLIFVDNYSDLPSDSQLVDQAFLPILCNRAKIWLGPFQFPWTSRLKEQVLSNPYYDPLRYELPKIFDEHQRSWIALSIIKMIAQTQLRCINCMYEYDLTKMRSKIWPTS